MRTSTFLNIADLRRLAQRRLPRILFDWLEGGTDDERLLARNQQQFARYRLIPRYLTNVERVDPSVLLFDSKFHNPFGIAPMGFTGLLRPGADLMLARAAASAGIPFILSGNSTTSIENIAAASDGEVWFQLYAARDASISADLQRRAREAGVKTLVYTIDTPQDAKRERDLRNGFDLPLRFTLEMLIDGLLHSRWAANYFATGGLPVMENWAPYASPGADALAVAQVMKAHYFTPQTWDDFRRIRDRWPGTLVIKGINDPFDAEQSCRMGADGMIVSNHGGRQLDTAPTALEILPHIRAAVPSSVKIMLDGGFRRGSDIVIAYCLGADFVFLGRAMLYGAIAGGATGASRAVEIIRDEVLRVMGQIGCCSVAELVETRIMAEAGVGDLVPVAHLARAASTGAHAKRQTAAVKQVDADHISIGE